MKNKSSFLKSILALLMLGLLFFSCKKEPSQIGLDIVGGNPLKVLFTDTATVKVYSVLRDSVRTDKLPNNILGYVVDPVFGKIKASLYAQFNLSLASFNFGENASLDSVVLSVAYKNTNVYGDSLAALSIKIYELNDLIDGDTSYYSNHTADYVPVVLGAASFVPRPNDSVLINNIYVEPHFSVHLSDDFGNKLMSFDDSVYFDNTDFTDHFKGLYIEPDYTGGVGNLAFLNLSSIRSKITIYYQNSTADSLSYNLYAGNGSPTFQNFDHFNYADADADFRQQVIEKDTLKGTQKFYLQTLGGVDSYISFPSLFNREDFDNYAINEAKLIITNIDEDNMFAQPSSMLLYQKKYIAADSTNNYFYIEDFGGGDAYFDGHYNSASKQYEFRITKYLQDYISGKFESDNMLMQILGSNFSGSRLIGGGSNPDINPESRIKLEIIYTEIETDSK